MICGLVKLWDFQLGHFISKGAAETVTHVPIWAMVSSFRVACFTATLTDCVTRTLLDSFPGICFVCMPHCMMMSLFWRFVLYSEWDYFRISVSETECVSFLLFRKNIQAVPSPDHAKSYIASCHIFCINLKRHIEVAPTLCPELNKWKKKKIKDTKTNFKNPFAKIQQRTFLKFQVLPQHVCLSASPLSLGCWFPGRESTLLICNSTYAKTW